MKYINQILTILLICAIIISAIFICLKIESMTSILTTKLSSSDNRHIYLHEDNPDKGQEILSLHETASYLNINDAADLVQMLEEGELQGTYFQSSSGDYFFVKEKVYQWCISRTEQ